MTIKEKEKQAFDNIVNTYVAGLYDIANMQYYKHIGDVEIMTTLEFANTIVLNFKCKYMNRAFYMLNGVIIELENVISPVAGAKTKGYQFGLYSRIENKYLRFPYSPGFRGMYKNGDR